MAKKNREDPKVHTVSRVLRENLRLIIAAYRKATGVRLATVSSKFYGNPNALGEYLDGGKSILAKKFDELVNAIRDDWPENGDWPMGPAVIIRGPGETR